jgi:Kef-type K+ transport system membrane component KefB
MNYLSEQNIFIFMLQILLLLGLARGLGELFRKLKKPPVTAEILAGIVLGPTILGRFFPVTYNYIFPQNAVQHTMLETIAWLGAFFFLLETGLAIDFSSAWRQRGDALKIAIAGIIIPLAIGFTACLFLPAHYMQNPQDRLIFSVFLATVMMISAMPVAARALHDLNLSKTDLSFLIMSALSVNDIIGWLIFTLVLGVFTQANPDIGKILVMIVFSISFIIICLSVGRKFTNAIISKLQAMELPQPAASLTFICLLGLLCGALTQNIGIHALFGFFIAGIMAGEAKALSERTRHIISQMVYAIFVPLFFAGIGLKTDFFSNFDILLVLFVSIIGIGGRFLGAWVGVNLTKVSKVNRLSVAIAHTPGGTMDIVVGLFALQYHLISETVFVAIVAGAVISSLLLGPWLSYSIKRRKEISILEYFPRETVISSLKADNKDNAIKQLCELAGEQENMPGIEKLYTAVMERENEMGTAVEHGIAIPHARFVTLANPLIVFGRSVAGIDWDSPDGKPTQFIFLILTPHGDEDIQVQILSLIAKVMSNKQARNEVFRTADSGEIWAILQKAFSVYHIVRK